MLEGAFTPGDVVVVTGAGSGIGRATTLRAVESGLDVVAWDIDLDAATITATMSSGKGPGTAQAGRVDVTDVDEVERAMASLPTAPRYLVNNAGPASAGPMGFGPGLVKGAGSVHAVTEAWLARQPPDGAAVVNLASVAGNLIGAEPDWYSATKSAIAGYTRHLAVRGAGRYRANAVAPGMIATPRSLGFSSSESLMNALARNPIGRMGDPDEVAWTILFLLSPMAGYINGVVLPIDGGWSITP